jgi:hypothetical protein
MTMTFPETFTIPVDLSLKRVSHMALCPLPSREWLLICTAKPQDIDPNEYRDRDRKEIFSLRLDSSGEILERTPPLDLSARSSFSYRDGIWALHAVLTPKGPALAVVNERIGPFLLLLDHELKVRGLSQINDPRSSGSSLMSRLAWNGKVLCAAWIQRHNDGERLCVRQFDGEGQPLAGVQQVAECVRAMAGPVTWQDGFAVTWTDFSQTPNQVRVCNISNDGRGEKQHVVFNGITLVDPIELAVLGTKAKVMMYDRRLYPRRLLLKEIALK